MRLETFPDHLLRQHLFVVKGCRKPLSLSHRLPPFLSPNKSSFHQFNDLEPWLKAYLYRLWHKPLLAMEMKVVVFEYNLSEERIKWASQIGADGFDIHNALNVPGVKEQGYPDLEKLMRLKRLLAAHGLGIYRVSLPQAPRFFLGEEGGVEEVEKICKTIQCLGEAGIPIARPMLYQESLPIGTTHMAEHRGGYRMRGFSLDLREKMLAEKPEEGKLRIEPKEYWRLCLEFYRTIVPVAEEAGVRLALHPSDPPLPGAPFSSLGWRRIIEAVPSEYNGLLYCVGTRYEEGGTRLVLDEIQYYGRKGKIFEVHFRNVRGSLATSQGFEEVALDDGDMNMFEILRALVEVGFDGPLNPDHVPNLSGDMPDQRMAWSYAVGYIKALIAALEAQW